MSEFTRKYEEKVSRPYSELGKGEFNPDLWGSAKFEGREINVYTDPEFMRSFFTSIIEARADKSQQIRVADFGGAEGTVINEISKQLKEDGFNVEPVNLDGNENNLRRMSEKFPDIEGVRADLSKIPLKDDSIDFGIIRFALPYNSKEKQQAVLYEIGRVLKPGGRLVIFQDGMFDKEQGSKLNEFFVDAVAVFSENIEEVRQNRYFASGEELTEMGKSAGLKIDSAKEINDIDSTLSTKAYASRFSLTDEQQSRMDAVFNKWSQSGTLPFADAERLERNYLYFVLEKA
jgi:ubiquinone/menaquinone biosynthesis C-methylase UbiE